MRPRSEGASAKALCNQATGCRKLVGRAVPGEPVRQGGNWGAPVKSKGGTESLGMKHSSDRHRLGRDASPHQAERLERHYAMTRFGNFSPIFPRGWMSPVVGRAVPGEPLRQGGNWDAPGKSKGGTENLGMKHSSARHRLGRDASSHQAERLERHHAMTGFGSFSPIFPSGRMSPVVERLDSGAMRGMA